MDTTLLKRISALAFATAAAGAWAGDMARIQPYPYDPRTIDAPVEHPTGAETIALVETPRGTMRVRTDMSDTPRRDDVGGPISVTIVERNGQRMRVVPGPEPEPAALPAAPALPAGAVVVEKDGAKMLKVPGGVDTNEPSASAAEALPPGIRIVDLPPGAVGPEGVPEPMTLYRVTPGAAVSSNGSE